jgi:glucosamine--fructose-6-phosphate aminotransferase (isomerizing)
MCGIIGYVGKGHSAREVLLGGLKKLEYRGYDSAGLAYTTLRGVVYERSVGEVENLIKKLGKETPEKDDVGMQVGIAHTRWATHGKPTECNAHPHKAGSIYLVHNGIIENHQELRAELERSGNTCISDTDSEVLAHLINNNYEAGMSLADAVIKALQRVRGAYGVVVLSECEPGQVIVARNSSPLILGIGEDEFIIASDASAIVPYTQRVVYLNDGDIFKVSAGGIEVLQGKQNAEKMLASSEEEAVLAGYPHFMLKEIHEQPEVIHNAYRGRIIAAQGLVKLGGIEGVLDQIVSARRIIIVSCGTSYNAGLFGEYLIESLAKISVEVEYASEFNYREIHLNKDDVVLAISQSGETADTLAAIRKAKKSDALTLGIVNVVGSSIARETDAGVYNHAGPEVSVASTKAFSSQVTVLLLLAILLGRESDVLEVGKAKALLQELETMPHIIEGFLRKSLKKHEEIANIYASYDNVLYLGRGYHMPLALEGALKIKELAYIHAEGYPAGEMKHGPIALIDAGMPCVVFAPKDDMYQKMLSTIAEVRARDGKVLAITTKGATEVQDQVDDYIIIPEASRELSPLFSTVSGQLLAYYAALARGKNVDRPRNLAKSVTVE